MFLSLGGLRMDFVKDIYEAWGARIKSNVFGSIAIAFILVNWKVLYFLVFADVRVETKFSYFDVNTDWVSLYFLPFLIGLLLAVGLPFINDLAHRIISDPISRVRARDDEYAHERLKKKNIFMLERNQAIKIQENFLIERAQRDQEIEKIDDEEAREHLKEQIEEVRTQVDEAKIDKTSDVSAIKNVLKDEEVEALITLQARPLKGTDETNPFRELTEEDKKNFVARLSSALKVPVSERRAKVQFNDAVVNLVSRRLVTKATQINYRGPNSYSWELTAEGYRVYDKAKSQRPH